MRRSHNVDDENNQYTQIRQHLIYFMFQAHNSFFDQSKCTDPKQNSEHQFLPSARKVYTIRSRAVRTITYIAIKKQKPQFSWEWTLRQFCTMSHRENHRTRREAYKPVGGCDGAQTCIQKDGFMCHNNKQCPDSRTDIQTERVNPNIATFWQ